MACCGGKKYVVKMPQVPEPKITVPQLQADGSIKFPEGVEILQIDGYTPCEDNPRLLKPNGPGCSFRITGVMLNKNGTYTPYHVCRHQKCEHRSKQVTFKICGGCPFRATE